jgi:excisionase family DNA binding protein
MRYLIYRLGKLRIGDDMAIGNKLDSMLTVREVAKLLNVHPNTLRRWADKGMIESFRITSRGDRRFVSRNIDQFLAEMNIQNKR